ncbi:MAG: glycerophosphodiester phosphodiesterase, partial [Aeromicrobium sp.]
MTGYLDDPPLAFAHRGGAKTAGNVGIENSLAAFTHAYQLGYRYLET